MHRETKSRVAIKHMQEGFVAAQVCIGQHFWKVSDWLVSMNTEKQGDRLGHRVILEKKPFAADLYARERNVGTV